MADARLTQEILKETGIEHEMVWTKDGTEALDYLSSDENFDMFILDLNLPKVGGYEILDAVRRKERFREIPVIMMTGSSSHDGMKKTEGKGPLHYLVKPMTIEEIDRTVLTIKDIVTKKI
jgi:putative two-component system response regulator